MADPASSAVLRAAVPSDVDGIARCARAAYTVYIERMGREPAPMVADFKNDVAVKDVVVACHNNKLLGYVVFYPEGDSMQLENIAVFPQYAGNGIGRKLIEHVEQTASALDMAYIELYTNEAMTENIAMYPALGYREFDRRCEDGFNRVYFRKRPG